MNEEKGNVQLRTPICWLCCKDATVSLDGGGDVMCESCWNELSNYEKMRLMLEYKPYFEAGPGNQTAEVLLDIRIALSSIEKTLEEAFTLYFRLK